MGPGPVRRIGRGRQRRSREGLALRTGCPCPRALAAGPPGGGPIPSVSRGIRPTRAACPPPASPGPCHGRRRGNRWGTPPRPRGPGPIPGSRVEASPPARRPAATKATSGARTVSGLRRRRKPVSAAKTRPRFLSKTWLPMSRPILCATYPCRPPAGAITTRSPLTSSVRLPSAARREERAGRSSADTSLP